MKNSQHAQKLPQHFREIRNGPNKRHFIVKLSI